MPSTPFQDLLDPDDRLPAALLADLPTPTLVVRLARVRQNLARMVALVGGEPARWRPHVKTTKLPAVWRELVRARVRRFKCATVREAGHLLATLREEGLRGADVLLAHPLVGPDRGRLAALAAEHGEQRVSILVEDPVSAKEMPAPLGLFVDVNTGMDRTGIPLADGATLAATASAAGERLRGFHAYDGHRHEPDPDLRREAAWRAHGELLETLLPLAHQGPGPLELCTSGTPSFRAALAFEPFARGPLEHTVSPGTVVFHDLRSELENPGLGLVPAATVLARVVSHPAPGRVTLDAGSKALGADAGTPCALVPGRPELEALAPSEEHLPLRVHAGPAPARGTLFELVPRHVCTTVNLADEALLVDGERTWTAPVIARGH